MKATHSRLISGSTWIARIFRSLATLLTHVGRVSSVPRKLRLLGCRNQSQIKLLAQTGTLHIGLDEVKLLRLRVKVRHRTAFNQDDTNSIFLGNGRFSEGRYSLLLMDIKANAEFWCDVSVGEFRKKGLRIARKTDSIVFGSDSFLADRILTYPEIQFRNFSPGLERLGGLACAIRIAWSIVLAWWSTLCASEKCIDMFARHKDDRSFAFAKQLSRTYGVNVSLAEDIGFPALLVQSGKLNSIYIHKAQEPGSRAFLVFHELAHLLLDHQGVPSGRILGETVSLGGDDDQEQEADALASILEHILRGFCRIAATVQYDDARYSAAVNVEIHTCGHSVRAISNSSEFA